MIHGTLRVDIEPQVFKEYCTEHGVEGCLCHLQDMIVQEILRSNDLLELIEIEGFGKGDDD